MLGYILLLLASATIMLTETDCPTVRFKGVTKTELVSLDGVPATTVKFLGLERREDWIR